MEADAVFVEPEGTYAECVDLRLGCEVTAVDPGEKLVMLADGSAVAYDRLALASGSLPRSLGTPGETLAGVHHYRTLDDAQAVRDAAGSASSALVIGGGFIGMETTASLRLLRARGHADRPRGRPLRLARLPAAVGSARAPLSRAGSRGHPGRRRGGVPRQRRRAQRRRDVRDGREIEADLAIVGVGVQPSTAYFEGSGVELERGTVLVDERFASNVPGIWAVGDIANFFDPVFGHRRLIQHWTNANHQGDRLGRLLAGQDTPYGQVAFFFSEVFGTKIGLLGDLDGGHDELVMRGSFEDGSLIGWYLRDEHLAAALIVGQTPDVQNELNSLLRAHARLTDRAALADPAASPAEAFGAGG